MFIDQVVNTIYYSLHMYSCTNNLQISQYAENGCKLYWMFILILKKMLFDHDLLLDHAQENLQCFHVLQVHGHCLRSKTNTCSSTIKILIYSLFSQQQYSILSLGNECHLCHPWLAKMNECMLQSCYYDKNLPGKGVSISLDKFKFLIFKL